MGDPTFVRRAQEFPKRRLTTTAERHHAFRLRQTLTTSRSKRRSLDRAETVIAGIEFRNSALRPQRDCNKNREAYRIQSLENRT